MQVVSHTVRAERGSVVSAMMDVNTTLLHAIILIESNMIFNGDMQDHTHPSTHISFSLSVFTVVGAGS